MSEEPKEPTKGEIVEPAAKTETKEEPQEELQIGLRDTPVGPMDDINYHRMADSLDISSEDRKIPHIQEKIAFLADWAKQETKSDDRLAQTLAIKELCKRLGFNVTGKDMVTKLYKWSYLDLQRRRIELQQELLK